MKKLIILCLLCALAVLLHFKCDAQPHFNMGAGYDTKTNLPLANIAAGYTAGRVAIEGMMQPSITRRVNANNYFGGSIGVAINLVDEVGRHEMERISEPARYGIIIPAVGYYYNLRNGDDKSQNTAAIGYSLTCNLIINTNGGLYARALYIEQSVHLTAGVHVVF